MRIWGPYVGDFEVIVPGYALYIDYDPFNRCDEKLLNDWFDLHDIEFILDETYIDYYFDIDEEFLALFIIEFAEFGPKIIKHLDV